MKQESKAAYKHLTCGRTYFRDYIVLNKKGSTITYKSRNRPATDSRESRTVLRIFAERKDK